jgi:endonuclease/exonuclease/phosphatase (EEP) superfamily protein YafD
VLAWLSTALAVLLFTLAGFPQLQARWTPLALAASFSPYALGLWLLAVLLTLVAGRGAARWWAVAPAAGLLLQAFTLTPYLPRPAESEPDHLSVATVNLRFGEAELARAADTALFSSEVLVLTEATAANLTVIDSPAWRRRFPYRVGKVGRSNAGDPHGTLILSAYPLTELGEASGSRFLNVAARASTPQGDLVVVGAHPQNPMGGAAGWVYDGAALTRLVERERGGLPVVVAGDLNAIDEHLTVRELLARGLSDAAVQAGAGWLPTWPANRWYPPLIPIDHVLVSDGLTATALRTVEIPGTDHLGLVAELRRG